MIQRIFSVKNFLKILCSAPVLLIILYFLPPLGIILLIARYFVYDSRHYYRAPIGLFIAAIIILIPHAIDLINDNFHLNIYIASISTISEQEIYPKLVDYTKSLIIISITFLVITYVLRYLSGKLSNIIGKVLSAYFSKQMENENKIAQENDLKLKEKAIEAKQKTPHVIKCPHCGKTNSIIGTVGKCKSCRSHIEYKGKL